jgi:hypothetical protein
MIRWSRPQLNGKIAGVYLDPSALIYQSFFFPFVADFPPRCALMASKGGLGGERVVRLRAGVDEGAHANAPSSFSTDTVGGSAARQLGIELKRGCGRRR